MCENTFREINSNDIEKLRTLLSADKVIPAAELSEDYAHDEMNGISAMPSLLIRAESTKDISTVMQYAYAENLPVVVRGSGTGLVGASVAVQKGIMIETLKMNQIIELDENNLCITLQPGVLLMELAAFCEENNLLYPPDPGEKSATIGGNISTNAGGMRALKYGVTRDYVQGLEVVLPTGEIIQLGGKVVKHASGYSLLDLIIGSEGTLGIITQIILKVVPLPKISLSLLVPFAKVEDALNAVPPLIRSALDFVALEFMEQSVLEASEEYLGKIFPGEKHPVYLLLTVNGETEPKVEALYEKAAALCISLRAIDVYRVDTQERKEAIWNTRGSFLEAIKASAGEMDECDVVVPRTEIADFLAYIKELSVSLDIRIPSFGHAGDGNLHIYLCRDTLAKDIFENRKKEAFAAMYKKAALVGGFVSGEHGIGYAKREYLAEQLGSAQISLMRGIKRVFDEKGILNPEKII